jgi:DNA segregation ATPase FtsK/SpoIIIE, S-DNA-T family
MRLKVTLERPGGAAQDLLITCDAATTVGDLAAYLRLSDPLLAASSTTLPAEPVTIGLVRDGHKALDPRTPLSDSPIRSGSAISVSRPGELYTDPASRGVAVATVVSGPDAGQEFALSPGTNIVGRIRSSEVRLSDVLVSRQHARLNVSDHIEIIDLGSANGVEMNGSLVAREVVRLTDEIRVGDTVLTVRMTQLASVAGRTDSASVGFIRSPRLAPRFEGREFEAPELPDRQPPQRFPMVMMLMPILLAAILYVTTRQLGSIIFVALSPMMMLGNYFEQRRTARRVDKASLQLFRDDLDDLVRDAEESAHREVSMRLAEYPSTSECVDAILQRSPLLWTRRPADWGFLELRLGLGELPSRSTVKLPDGRRGPRDLYKEAASATEHLGHVSGVPVVAMPSLDGGLGVAGARSAAVAAGRAFLLQAAALHSPTELAIGVFASSRSAEDWDWVKWLPQVDAPSSPLGVRHLVSTPGGATQLLSAVETVIEARDGDGEGDGGDGVPAVLLLVESDTPVEFGRLVSIAERGWRHGVYVIWVAPEVAQLPAACRTFVDTRTMAESGVGFVHTASSVTPVVTEGIAAEDALRAARSLGPVVDLGARTEDSSDLPRSISFLALDGHERLGDDPSAVIERWQQNHSILTGPEASVTLRKEASLRAVIGHSAGQLHALDLRVDGPHALVGGTTGAGKSELLQTWILSMAASHSPQRLTFLLVDYKGGSAFADCARLPHTVGLVTDLNPNGVRRALTSLSAELKYREEFLHRNEAKDLMALEKKGATDAPPSLVIVVDEFAALVQEVPEFVEGVVNVAQRGRSLGLHLILATQRPAGVIKDNLRANTNLRLALRVADEADSSDVLGSPEAAFFDQDLPGRAVSKTGPGRLVPFQTAYVGGHTGGGTTSPDIRVEEFTMGSAVQWEVPEQALPPKILNQGKTDIARVVDTIADACKAALLPAPRKPWLPDLKDFYNLKSPEVPGSGGDELLVFGVADDPANQSQHVVAFQPDRDGNLAIFGAGGSGKSTMLRTLAVAAGFAFGSSPCHVYGLDFGARGLSMIEQLPHVGSVIPGSDDERVRRLIRWLREVVDERAQRYAAVNADSVTQYRVVSGRADEPRILVLLDGLSAFRQAYESGWNSQWFDRLVGIAADGRPVGVHLVVTADRPGALPTQLASTIQRRLALRMADANDYGMLNVPHDVLTPSSPAGRGIWGEYEVQVAVLGGHADLGEQAREMGTMAKWMQRANVTPAPAIQKLPEEVDLDSLPVRDRGGVAIGIEANTMGAFGIQTEGTFVISGPPGSGRSGTIATVVAAVCRAAPLTRTVLLTADRRSRLLRASSWSVQGVGLDQGREAAEDLVDELKAHAARSNESAPVVVVVEGLAEWAGSLAENAILALFKAVADAGALVVTDGEASAFISKFGLPAAAKASRVGIMLQPEPSDGTALFGADLPIRLNRADFPPGRGYYARGGRAALVQIALAPGWSSNGVTS